MRSDGKIQRDSCAACIAIARVSLSRRFRGSLILGRISLAAEPLL
jgi:hypothetical protein